jgi:hypothetical protein
MGIIRDQPGGEDGYPADRSCEVSHEALPKPPESEMIAPRGVFIARAEFHPIVNLGVYG